jgi:hypothetical protein
MDHCRHRRVERRTLTPRLYGNIPRIFSGAASGPIDHALRRLGRRIVTSPTSFLVDTSTHLETLRTRTGTLLGSTYRAGWDGHHADADASGDCRPACQSEPLESAV